MGQRCAACGGQIKLRYVPMEEWGIDGPICGACYSKRIDEHYPGEHVRVNSD